MVQGAAVGSDGPSKGVLERRGDRGHGRAVGVSQPTVIKWRDRFAAHGIAGRVDEPRSGRPKTVDDAAIIAATLDPPPESLAVTHWSSRLLGARLGVGDATVARAWRCQPGHRPPGVRSVECHRLFSRMGGGSGAGQRECGRRSP